jgi:transcriptional regulator with XRE-family HTH domain
LDTVKDFVKWLEEEMAARHWRTADLATAAGLYHGTLAKVLNGDRRAGPEVCLAIAKALNIPADSVFRRAGLLPELPGTDRDPTLQETMDVMKNMTPEERLEVLQYALFRFQKRTKGDTGQFKVLKE